MKKETRELKDSIIAKIEELFDTVAEDQCTDNDVKINHIPDNIKLIPYYNNTGIVNTDKQLLYYDKNVKYKVLNGNAYSGSPHMLIPYKFKDVPIGRVFLSNGLEYKKCVGFYYIKTSDKYGLYWNLNYDIWFPQPISFALDEDVYLAEPVKQD